MAAGGTASFTVAAGGSQPLGYQWRKDGSDLADGGSVSGARTASLTVTNVQVGDLGNYSVVVSNSNGWVVSSNASLTGPFPPFIMAPPASQKVVAGSSALLTATVAGMAPFTYQWRLEGTNLVDSGNISGAATASLVVSNVQIGECGNYSLVVSNTYGGTTSANALLGLWPLAAWGRDDYTQTDIPAGLSSVVAVAAGFYHSLALKADGTVAAWGAGETNSGTIPYCGQAAVPGGLSNVVAVAGGYYHSLALRSDSTVSAWGAGTSNTGVSPLYGQAMVPMGLSNVVALAAGGYHSLALKADGTMVAWGAGTANTGLSPNYGQALVPAGLTGVVAIAAGAFHSLAVKADGTVVAWGAGMTNLGSIPHYGQALIPAGLTGVVAVAAGTYHSLALKADGTVVAWGAGTTNTGLNPNYGQSLVPAGLTGVVAVAAGMRHSLALKADGTTLGWGDNSYHQTNNPNGVANGMGIAAGAYHNLVMEGDGRPSVTVQPFSQALAAGANASFTAMAVGIQPVSYQWQHNGVDMAGATDASLSLTNLQAASAGSYSLVVTNAFGAASSANAVLTVTGQPNHPHIDSLVSLPAGGFALQVSGGPGNFAVEAAPTPSGWTQLSSLTATGAVFQYIDPDTNQASRFYRIRLLP